MESSMSSPSRMKRSDWAHGNYPMIDYDSLCSNLSSPSSSSSTSSAGCGTEIVICDSTDSLYSDSSISDFEIKEDLGGDSSTNDVKLASAEDGTQVVVKKIAKDQTKPEWLEGEVEAGKRLENHDGIVTLREYFEDNQNLYLVFDYVKGYDLWSYMEKRDFLPLPLKETRDILRQLIEAVVYIHDHNIAHRDIKLDNIVVNPQEKTTTIIDFGLCQVGEEKEEEKECTDWIGSVDYACPEILKKEPYSGYAADVWSLGVVLYILLCGELPFGRADRIFALASSKHPDIVWPEKVSASIPEIAKALVARMLEVDPDRRITLDEIREHPFLENPIELLTSVVQRDSSL